MSDDAKKDPKDNATKLARLRQLVEQKTQMIKQLNLQLDKEDAELVWLEQQLESLEDQSKQSDDH